METAMSNNEIFEIVASVVAEVSKCSREEVLNDTRLPDKRHELIERILRYTSNPGSCPYTGEAKTVGKLVEALMVPDSKLKWNSEAFSGLRR